MPNCAGGALRISAIGLSLACFLLSPSTAFAGGEELSSAFHLRAAPGNTEFRLRPSSVSSSPIALPDPAQRVTTPAFGSRMLDEQTVTALPRQERKLGRGLVEISLLMTYSQTRYWLNYAKFIEDWQYHLSWKDQKKRFFTFQAWRFDSNAFSLNWTHSFAGVLYYSFGRTNHVSWPQSFLFSLGGSLWWEYVAEWREVISINDNIMTSIGGYAAGEPWFQLGKYFIGRKGIINQVLGGLIHPVLKFNHWLDRENGKESYSVTEPGWHDFQFMVGQKRMPTTDPNSRNTLFLGVRTEIVQIPDYGKPGRTGRMLTDTLASDFDFDFSFRHGQIEEFNFATSVVGLGWFKQDIDPGYNGYAYYIGLGSGFTLFKKKSVWPFDSSSVPVKQGFDLHLDEPRDFRDKLSAVHIGGPAFEYSLFRPNSRLRVRLNATLDFGLVNAYALNKYSVDHSIEGIKTTLFYYGYYYGIGTTLSSALRYNYRHLAFDARLCYQEYGSFDGRDRYQAEVTDNFHVRDRRVTYLLGASVRIPGTSVLVAGEFEGIDRMGIIKDVDVRNLEERFSLAMSMKF